MLGRPSGVRTRESDRVDRGVHGRGRHCGEVKKKVPLFPTACKGFSSHSLLPLWVHPGLEERGLRERAGQPSSLEGSRNRQDMAPGHPYKSPKGRRALLRARSRVARGGAGAFLLVQDPWRGQAWIRLDRPQGAAAGQEGSGQSAGKEASRIPLAQPLALGYSQAPVWCVMTKQPVGLPGWKVQNTAFVEAGGTGGLRHRLPPFIPPFKRNIHDLQPLLKAIKASPSLWIHPCQGPGIA